MNNGVTANANRLLWAGFVAILAAGVGFAIRGGIFETWRATFGFTGLEVGLINGGGFTGFCFGIIIGGFLADRIGYGKLVVAAFILHVISAVVTFVPSDTADKTMAFNYLWVGTFLFSAANGTLEAVANPLVATLFPNKRTHYLNILHASWPAGMIIGGLVGIYLGEKLAWHWKWQLGLFLVPTLIYGTMFFGQHFPKSEASSKGLSMGQMLKDVGVLGSFVIALFIGLFLQDGLGPLLAGMTGNEFFGGGQYRLGCWIAAGVIWLVLSGMTRWAVGAFLLFVLFIVHAMVGAVELGTDSWIQNITGNIMDPTTGKWLFVYTSAIMFALRFCAHFIETKLGFSPIGILLACSVLAVLGLNLVSIASTTGLLLVALLIYGVGKTFFWPTMLAVASDRYPRTGAVAISIMGGLGMMSAGLIGSPGLGYAKDRFASEALQKENPGLYEEYKAEKPGKWLVFEGVAGLDGKKLGEVKATPPEKLTAEQKQVLEADLKGDRKTLVADSIIPMIMTVIFLIIAIYFRSIGGYKPVHIDTEKATGGVEAPVR
jgi:MFS family permease